MSNKSRTFNSIRNLVFGVGTQGITFILNFVLRTVFITILGKELLGVNGLYGNILTILSLAELGLSTVMIYSLYKPIQEENTEKIKSLIYYFKSLYNKIALVVFVLGMMVVPFLPFFIKSDLEITPLRIYYVLFLLNTVFSYICIYKTALINADQKAYLIKNNNLKFYTLKVVLQMMILLLTKNYYFFLVTEVVITLVNNMYLGKVCDKYYPYITEKHVELDKTSKEEISQNLKSMSLYKVGVVIMNNTDNILISKLVGTVWVGMYSNYGLFISAINTFINTFITSIFSSIGNLNNASESKKQREIFDVLLLIFHWVAAFCSICFLAVFNDVITIWLGTDYLLSHAVVGIVVFNFYLSNIINPVWIYRETMGVFHTIKYTMLISSVINIVLSIVLGLKWGIFGIFAATAISRLLTTVWYEPVVLFKNYFHCPVKEYYFRQFRYMIISLVSLIVVLFILRYIPQVSILGVVLKLLTCILVVNGIFFLLCHNQKEFKMFMNDYVLKILKR